MNTRKTIAFNVKMTEVEYIEHQLRLLLGNENSMKFKLSSLEIKYMAYLFLYGANALN